MVGARQCGLIGAVAVAADRLWRVSSAPSADDWVLLVEAADPT